MFLRGVGLEPQGTFRTCCSCAYQGTFAIITAALISGAIVERMRFSAYVVFITLWALVVYSPIAHWVWGGGWLAKWARSISPAARSCTSTPASPHWWRRSCVGKRQDYPSSSLLPHNVPFTLLGAGLLWFGWFGFNAGSALAANAIAGLAFVTTMLAPGGDAGRLDVARCRRVRGKPTAVGAATAIVVGLVAITPAAGFISPMSAIVLGAHRGRSRATSALMSAPRPRSTTRSTSSPRTAWAGPWARC